MSARLLFLLAAVVGAIGIAVGAFGAHAVPNLLEDLPEAALEERLDWLDTGSRYHLLHAVALLALAVGRTHQPAKRFSVAAIAWLVGIVLFSGCLYVMAISGVRLLGAVVPLGGLAFIAGWLALAIRD